MNNSELREVMKYQLKNFDTNNVKITDKTLHKEILSGEDGIGTVNSKRIYKSFIRWTLIQAGEKESPWPKNWIDLSVADLSIKLIDE